MLPIAPLMIEHRLIERMIGVLEHEIARIQDAGAVDPVFVDQAVDFIRVYADKTHHGKEEEILFRELAKKPLDEDHARIMAELVEEHKFGRQTTAILVSAKDRWVAGEREALEEVLQQARVLVEFYPEHIDKEDNHFFKPVMEYFSPAERADMLVEGHEFDRKMIHWKYLQVVKAQEAARSLPGPTSRANWLDFI